MLLRCALISWKARTYLTQMSTIRMRHRTVASTLHWRFRRPIKISELSVSSPVTTYQTVVTYNTIMICRHCNV